MRKRFKSEYVWLSSSAADVVKSLVVHHAWEDSPKIEKKTNTAHTLRTSGKRNEHGKHGDGKTDNNRCFRQQWP